MLDRSTVETYFRNLTPEQLRSALAGFLPENATREERVCAIENALRGPGGTLLRAEMGRWIVEKMVPVETLVPIEYADWRPPVRDAMLFVVSHLSAARLAPKLQEQLELPQETPSETRLLQLIARVPGLQKLGQVLARNRKLRPSLRNALSQLENGIRDVTADEIVTLVKKQLGDRLQKFAVEIDPKMLSEASVSAVVRFTWRNAESGKREKGVFKVLKPYIPVCFAEDMELLQQLAEYFGSRYVEYGFARHVLTDTFTKVRRLLQHEVDFAREQATLVKAHEMYRSLRGVRVPRLIRPLCTSTITAITEERGTKVTDAVVGMSARRRRRVAERLIEALVAVPLFTARDDAMFHADPHAGNLLYDQGTDELILLDWALTERLSRNQRRHLAMLLVTLGLRDPVGARREILELTERKVPSGSPQGRKVRETVDSFLNDLPLTSVPGAVDAMKLLEQVAVKGIRFPAPLIMFSKVMFTLDGVVHDIGGQDLWVSYVIARHVGEGWLRNWTAITSPIAFRDWLTVQRSAMLYGSRFWVQCQQAALDRLLPRNANASGS